MASASTLVSSSPKNRMSIARTPWLTGGCSTSSLAAVSSDPSSSDQVGEPCAPPSGKIGSLASLLSPSVTGGRGIARVTSDLAFAITMGIAAITAIAMLTTGREGTTPIKEGHTTTSQLPTLLVATRRRLGLHSSHMGGGDIPSPVSSWTLPHKHRLVTLKNSTMRTNGSMNTYLDKSGRTLKPRLADDEPTETRITQGS